MKRFFLERFPDRVWDNIATVSVLGMCAVLGLFGWFIYDLTDQNRHRIRDIHALTQQTHVALCTFRADLEQRVRSSEEFLKEHPKGIPGIPLATIRQGITNQQRTVDSLANLNC